MVRLLIYDYTTGIRSSRAIEHRCVDDVAFRFLAADQAPDYRSIARFRRRHLDALADLFLQSLHLAQKLGMVKMGRVALDGTKLEASASKHEAMSYGRLIDKEECVEAEIAALEAKAGTLLADAQATDAAEDQIFGGDGKDTNLPAELDRREKRLARLQAARLGHGENITPAPSGRIPKNTTLKERMARKLRTKPGRRAYSRRKAIVEPVFGQIMTCQMGRQLLPRGEAGACGEWRLLAACHNFRKIFRHTGRAGLATAIA